MLGVTNPFFAKTLQQWPHIIRVGEMPNLSNSFLLITFVAFLVASDFPAFVFCLLFASVYLTLCF